MTPVWSCARKLRFLLLFLIFAAGASAQETARSPKPAGPAQTRETTQPTATRTSAKARPASTEEAVKQAQADKEALESDQLEKRTEWFYRPRSNAGGRIPAGARWAGYQHVMQMMEGEGKVVRQADGSYAAVTPHAGAPSTPWTSIGPTPTTSIDYGPVTGRITTIAVDPSDATGSTLLIGGAQGGIWRSTNAGQTWTAVGDQNASLAMGSIAFAPSNSSIVYAGTGEQAGIGWDIYYGAGVLKSTDHGQTWASTCTVASATCPFIGPYSDLTPFGYFTLGGTRIGYVAVNPNNPQMVLVAAQTQFTEGTTEGVYCTDNSGSTWSKILPDQMSTFVGFASSTVAYAALGNPYGSSSTAPNGNGIYKATGIGSTCSTVNFTRLTSATLPMQSTMGRIDIGIAPSDTSGNTLYASIASAADGSASDLGVFSSTNGGTSWTNTAAPDVCQPQCWYNNVIKVDPNNKNIVYFGGAAAQNSGQPAWVVRSSDGGVTWNSVLPTSTGAGLPHADTHALAFFKSSSGVRLYLGNDGGIWRTDNAEAGTVTWTNLNDSTLTLSQFYPAVSTQPASPLNAIGGTQDNGTQIYSGMPDWQDINICGDGTGTAIDYLIPTTVYIACNGFNLLASYQGGAPGTYSFVMNGINAADNSSFVPPLAADPNSANTLYAATSKVYQSVDAGNTWTAISGDLVSGNQLAYLTALGVATVQPGNSGVIYAGAQNGALFVATNLTAGSASFGQVGGGILPGRTITSIAVDPTVAAGTTAYVGFSGFSFVNTGAGINDPTGQIFRTTDGGVTWKDVSCSVAVCTTRAATDLPNVPVNDLVADPDLPGTIYAATDLGVFVGTCTASSCAWATLGTGLPRVAVLSLKLHEPSRTLRAATHGRGVWDNVLNNFSFTGPHISSLSPTSANAGAAQLTLTVKGTGLTGGSIQFGSTALAPTGTQSGTSLSGTLPSSLLMTGSAQVTVKVGSGISNALTFVVTGGAPTLTSVTPASTPVQANPVTNVPVTLAGANFVSSSKVSWNGAAAGITATFNDTTSLTATLPGALLGPYGSTNDISVVDPPPGGGQSTAKTFKVAAPPPANDAFASAINITDMTFSDDRDSSSATTESTDPLPSCVSQYTVAQGNTGGQPNGLYNTIWYKFTPSFSAPLEVDTIGSSYDTVLSFFSGSPGSLSLLACNDDINPGVVTQSLLTGVGLNSGTTYYIAVGSFGPPDPNPVALGGHAHVNFSYNNGGNPPAQTTSISPTTVTAGGPAFTLTVNGTNFINGAVVLCDCGGGNVQPSTTFVSSTQVAASIDAHLITLPGSCAIAVSNPPPGGGQTPNTVPLTVSLGVYPVPTINTINPSSIVAGTFGGFTIDVLGDNFATTAVLAVNGNAKPTTVITRYELTASIPATDIMNAGTAQITVVNPSPGGGPSAPATLTILQPNPLPTITSLSPPSAPTGSNVTLTINGTNFESGSLAHFNGQLVTTQFVSSTQLTALFNTGNLSPGNYAIAVTDPYPGGTAYANFVVTGPPDFSLTASTAGQTVPAGQTATFPAAITVTPMNGFSSSVSLSCSLAARATTCLVSPVTLPTGSGSADVHVTTTARSGAALPDVPWQVPILGLLLVVCLGILQRIRPTRLRFAVSALGLLFMILLALQGAGCGGGGGSGPPPPQGTPAGTYTVTVTAISGSDTHRATLTLTVN